MGPGSEPVPIAEGTKPIVRVAAVTLRVFPYRPIPRSYGRQSNNFYYLAGQNYVRHFNTVSILPRDNSSGAGCSGSNAPGCLLRMHFTQQCFYVFENGSSGWPFTASGASYLREKNVSECIADAEFLADSASHIHPA